MKIIIDGKEIEAKEGQSVLEAALAANVFIPHLCSHPDLEAKGGCRLCSVEIEGSSGAVPACETMAKDGMRLRDQRAGGGESQENGHGADPGNPSPRTARAVPNMEDANSSPCTSTWASARSAGEKNPEVLPMTTAIP